MGSFSSNGTNNKKQTTKRRGTLVRVSTGEKIQYNSDPERSKPKVTEKQKQEAETRYQQYRSAAKKNDDRELGKPWDNTGDVVDSMTGTVIKVNDNGLRGAGSKAAAGFSKYLADENTLADSEVVDSMTGTVIPVKGRLSKDRDKYTNVTNKDTFTGQFSANYGLGRLTQDQSMAWNIYLDHPTAKNLEAAKSLDAMVENFKKNNQKALDEKGQVLPAISRSAANYLPQLYDQTAAKVKGGILGGTAFAVATGGAGTVSGIKTGSSIASGIQSYQTMRGAAYKNLLSLGVDDETARTLANDEGFINGLIEAGDTAMDWAMLGGGKALNAVFKGALSKASTAAGKNAGVRALKVVGGYLGNIASEGFQESAQESVTIANENRALTGDIYSSLVKDAFNVARGAITGDTEQDRQNRTRIAEAGIEGAKIAAMMGGAQLATNYGVVGAANAIHEAPVKREQAAIQRSEQNIDRAYDTMLNDGMFSQQARDSVQAAQNSYVPTRGGLTADEYLRTVNGIQAAQEAQQEEAASTPIQAEEAAQAQTERSATPISESNTATTEEPKAVTQEPIAQETTKAEPVAATKRTTQKTTSHTAQETSAQTSAAPKTIEEVAAKYGKQAEAVQRTYNEGQDVAEFARAFDMAYEYGKRGATIESALNSQSASYLTDQQKTLAYNIGKAAAGLENKAAGDYTQTINNETEGVTNGEGVRVRDSGQRLDGQSTEGQTGAVAEGTGRVQSGNQESRPRDSEAAALSYGEEVSTSALGIQGGATNDSIRIVQSGSTRATSAAQKIADERGLKLVLFGGDNIHVGNVEARACIIGDTMYVRADHAEYTAEQLTEHEVGHDRIAKGEINVQDVRDELATRYAPEDMDRIAESYAMAVDGTDMTAEEIWEEIICDSLAGINVFSGTSMEDSFMNTLVDTWDAAQKVEKKDTRGPPAGNTVKASRESKGDKYWRPDLKRSEWDLLNRSMEAEIESGDNYLDKATKWVFASEKGTTVFAIYGIGDGTVATPLYACGGNKAVSAYQKLNKILEEAENGAYRNREVFNLWAKTAKGKQRETGRNLPHAGNGKAADENDSVYSGTRGSDRGRSYASGAENRGEVKPKFSMEAPVERTRELLALHNKDENSILAAIKLGGLPMPSIAVVKAEQGHTKYGPISLVFSKDTIDPQLFRANKVYGGDAWTPTAPQVDYPVNSKKASQVERELHRLSGDTSVAGGIFGNSAALRSMGIDDTSTGNTAELAEKLASTDTVRAAYLADQGKSLEPVKMDKVWDKFGNDTLQKVVDRLGVNTLAEIEASLETGESVKDALGENAEVIRDILRDYYREQGEPMLRRMAAKRGWTNAEINERRQTRIDNSMDGVSIFTLEDIVHHAWDMYQDGGATKGEIDRMATSDALRSAVDDHAVEEWIAGKLDGLLGEAGIYNGKDPYTPSGNLRSFSQLHYAYTLENIVKAMKEGQEERGGNTWGASAKTLQSVATPEYRSIQEIKADSGRLGMDEGAEYEAKLQAIDDQIGSIITKIKQGNKAHSDNSFVESDIIGSILMETSKGKRTVDAIMRAFSKEGYKISSQTAQDIQAVYQAAAEMPTGYFEAKPRRAVGFDEVLAAVIPDDSSQKLRDGLEQAGVRMLEYKTGDDADRLAKINSVEGARFSRKGKNAKDIEAAMQERAAEELKASRETGKTIQGIREENTLLEEKLKEATKEANAQRARAEKWKGETKLTETPTLREADVRKAVTKIAKSYESAMTKDAKTEVIKQTKALGEYIMNGGDQFNEELRWTDVKEKAMGIATIIVENAESLAGPLDAQTWLALKDKVRTTPLAVTDTMKSDIADYGDFRARYMGRLNLANRGTGVDQFYQELTSTFGEGLFPSDVMNPTDQLLHIAQTLDTMQPVEKNPHSYNMAAAIEYCANDLIDELLSENVRQTAPTFADKAEKKLTEQIIRDNEKLERLREQKNQRIEELKAQGRETAKMAVRNERDSVEKRKYRKRVEDKAKKLRNTLLTNSDKQHVPEGLKTVVGEFLNSIDFSSKSAIDGKELTKKDRAYLDALDKVRQVLQKQADYMANPEKSDGNDMYLDMPDGFVDEIQKHINTVKSAAAGFDSNTNVVNAMSVDALKDLDFILNTLNSTIGKANKLIANAHFATVYEAAQNTANHLNAMTADTGKLEKLRGFAAWDNALPYYAFKRFGEAGRAIFEGLMDGWDKMTMNVKAVEKFTSETYKPKEVREWSTTVQTVKLSDGREAKMTTAQIMSLYCLSKREQAMGHLRGGGMRVGNIDIQPLKNGAKGTTIRQTEPFLLTEEDIAGITSMLTDRQIEVADALQKYMNTVGTKWGNEVSMERFGYRAFTEENYFPIESDSTNLPAVDPEAKANDMFRLLNLSMTKGLVNKANNALVVSDIFDVFANHMTDMAKYNGLALPILDTMKWYNYKQSSKNEDGQIKTTTVQRAIERTYGKNGKNYFVTFIKDLNGTKEGGRGTDFARKMVSNYKVAAVAANLRVAALQITAYPRAVAVLHPGAMAKAMVQTPSMVKRNIQEMQEHSGIAVWKSMGFYDTNIGRGVREQIKNDFTFNDRLVEKSMKGAEFGDTVTWATIWNACKIEQTMKGVPADQLMDATAKRFREVIYSTQVIDSTMTRSHVMRSSNLATQTMTSFMSEPTMSYNLLMDAYDEYRIAKRKGDPNAWKNSGGKIARALLAYSLSQITAALMESLMDALRDDDDYETLADKYLQALIGEDGKYLEGNLLADLNPLNKLPILKDAFNMLTGYSNDRMETQWLSSIGDAWNAWKSGNYTTYGKIYKTMQAASRIVGNPMSNTMRDAVMIWNNSLGIITGKRIKVYDKGIKSNIKSAYTAGSLTAEEAATKLVSENQASDKDEALRMIHQWDAGEDGQYGDLYTAAKAGQNISEEMKALTSNGYDEEKVISALTSEIGNWYKGTDDEPASISKSQAETMLRKYTDLDADAIEKKVREWSCKKDTGINYNDIKSSYLGRKISKSQAVSMIVKYGGVSRSDAEERVRKYDEDK